MVVVNGVVPVICVLVFVTSGAISELSAALGSSFGIALPMLMFIDSGHVMFGRMVSSKNQHYLGNVKELETETFQKSPYTRMMNVAGESRFL